MTDRSTASMVLPHARLGLWLLLAVCPIGWGVRPKLQVQTFGTGHLWPDLAQAVPYDLSGPAPPPCPPDGRSVSEGEVATESAEIGINPDTRQAESRQIRKISDNTVASCALPLPPPTPLI